MLDDIQGEAKLAGCLLSNAKAAGRAASHNMDSCGDLHAVLRLIVHALDQAHHHTGQIENIVIRAKQEDIDS